MKNQYIHLSQDGDTSHEAMKRLEEIVRILRVQCPWDREQTHKSLTKNLIEEAYELVDAINRDDFENLREELGDVTLQVVFHSILADEESKFNLADIINEECRKMIRRHPHVFEEEIDENGRFSTKSVDKVLERWENIKSKEHNSETYCQDLETVPKSLPALMRSQKVQKKASNVGFDWDSVEGAFQKIEEESNELKEAYLNGDFAEMENELGDLLFSVVNVSRFLKIDAEEALTLATEKFINRFREVERIARSEGDDLKKLSLEEMEILWQKAKEK